MNLVPLPRAKPDKTRGVQLALTDEELEIEVCARDAMVEQWLPLVKWVIGRMAVRPIDGMGWDDLLAEGTIGLVQAVDRFDPNRGAPFSSYAERRIRGAIIDAIRALSPITRTGQRRKAAGEAWNVVVSVVPIDDANADRLHMYEPPDFDDGTFDAVLEGLRSAMQALSARDQLVLDRYYAGGVPLKQIGRELHISASRVSQLRLAAEGRLRVLLDG